MYAWDERKNQRFKVPDATSRGIDHSFESGLAKAKASQQEKMQVVREGNAPMLLVLDKPQVQNH